MAENNIKLTVQLEGDQALRTISALTRSVDNFSDNATKGFKKTDAAVSSFAGNLAAIGTSKALGFLSAQFSEAARSAIEFDKAVAEINTLLPANERLTKKTTDAFLELSSAYGKDVTTQTRAFYDIVSAGVKGTSEQIAVLTAANEAAVAGLVDVNIAADILTSSINSYSQSGLTATQASDALFVAVKEGKTTFDELASSVGKVAPTAAAAGLEFTELTGTLAAITKNGVSTAEAVTGLQAIISSIIKPSVEAKKAAKELGIEYSVAGIKAAGGFANFLGQVKEATNGNIETLGRLIPNVRGLGPAVGIVTGDLEGFKATLDASKNSIGATAEAAEILKQSLSFKLEQTQQSVKNLGIELFNNLAPQIQLVSNFWANALKNFNAEGSTRSIEEVDAELKKLEETTDRLAKELGDKKDNFIFNSFLGAKADRERELADALVKLNELRDERARIAAEIKENEKTTNEEIANDKKETAQKEVEIQREKFNLLNELNAEQKAFLEEAKALEEEERLAAEEIDIQRIQEALGRENAIREVNRIRRIQDEKKQQAELKKLRDKAAKEEQASIVQLFDFEKATNSQKVAAQRETIRNLANIQTGGNKALFFVQKSAAITNAGINIAEGVTKALALGPILGPIAAGVLAASGAIQVAKIASAKPPSAGSFAEGGLIQGRSQVNDRLTAQVNAGETILNRRQSDTVFRAINEGNLGGGGTTVNISNPMVLEQGAIDDIIDQINDAIEFRNKELRTA